MRREQNVMLQCIRHVVSTGFLGQHKSHDAQHKDNEQQTCDQQGRKMSCDQGEGGKTYDQQGGENEVGKTSCDQQGGVDEEGQISCDQEGSDDEEREASQGGDDQQKGIDKVEEGKMCDLQGVKDEQGKVLCDQQGGEDEGGRKVSCDQLVQDPRPCDQLENES